MTRLRLAALGLCLALGASACGGNGADTGRSDTPAVDQSLRVGYVADQYVLEGPRASLGMYPLNANIVETLTYLTPDYKVEPLLAKRWELIEPNTWRFYLREGVAFHDGQPLTAEAVKEGLFDRVAQSEGGGTIKSGPDSAVVVDDMTIDFTPLIPNLRVPEQLVHPNAGVVAPGSTIGVKPVGTGPFKFFEYKPKEIIKVERNAAYWGEKAKLERIEFRFYPDANARKLALESGNVDAIYDVPRPDVEGLKAQGFTILNSPVGAYEAMYANSYGKPPFDKLSDVRLRKAVAMSIDRKALVNGVLEGLATTDQTYVPPSSLGKYADLVEGNDLDEKTAKALLDEAGWVPGDDGIRTKGGERLKLTLVSGFPTAEVHRPIPVFLQSQLVKVGIDLEIVERPDSASFQAIIKSGEGDLFLEQGSQNDANPGFLPVLLLYTGGSGASAPYQSLFAPGQRFDELIAPSLTAADPDDVKKAVAEAMHEAVDVQATVIPLAGIFRTYGMRKQVKGFEPHAASLHLRWDDVFLVAS